MAIRSLCITEDADRPTIATFIGMHNAGIEVTVSCAATHPNYQRLVNAGVRTIDIPFRKNIDRQARQALRTELIKGRYHILHTFSSRPLSNGLKATRDLPVKVIAYRGIVGNLSVLDPVSWQRYLNPRIDRIVCVAEAIRQWFLHMQPAFLRMPATRPITIHKGHKLEWYEETPADLGTVGIPADAFTVACTATYRPRKGVEYLVEALERLPADVPAHLVLIGRMDAKRLTKRIARSPAAARIHRIGYRSNAPTWTAACDVFCLPSTKREGLARSIIEAMAYRVPPIVTNSGGSPELVVDGDSGLVVPVRDAAAIATAIEKLYRDPELRRRMGDSARRRIGTDFRNEDTVRKTIALYQELVPNPDAKRSWPG
jgi:glycosyltransferase involved in cell wall biosynthesis